MEWKSNRAARESRPRAPNGLKLGPDGDPCHSCLHRWAWLAAGQWAVTEATGGGIASKSLPGALSHIDVRSTNRYGVQGSTASLSACFPVRSLQSSIRRFVDSLIRRRGRHGLLTFPCIPHRSAHLRIPYSEERARDVAVASHVVHVMHVVPPNARREPPVLDAGWRYHEALRPPSLVCPRPVGASCCNEFVKTNEEYQGQQTIFKSAFPEP